MKLRGVQRPRGKQFLGFWPSGSREASEFWREFDDHTGEDLAHAVDHLRAQPSVLDIIQAPAFGKNGRMMTQLRVLARPVARDDVVARIFDETTTIGVRRG